MNKYEGYIIGDGCLIAPNSDVIILDLSESLKKYTGYLIGPNGDLIDPNGNPVENEDEGYIYDDEDYDLSLEYAFSDIQEYEVKKENNCFDFFEIVENIFNFFLIKND
jgi:hypothetical protein